MTRTSSELLAANQYGSYQAGWLDGARCRGRDPALAQHDDELLRAAYEQGYNDASIARDKAMRAAQTRYGHRASVLRDAPFEEARQSG